MPRSVVGTAKVDAKEQLRKRIEDQEALLKRNQQKLRSLSKRDYTNRCLELGKVLEACGLFEAELGDLETLLKAGKRATKEKRGEGEV